MIKMITQTITKLFIIFVLIFLNIQNVYSLVELDGFVLDEFDDAVCNSGSPASYYLKINDPNKYAVLIAGGGSAYSDEVYRKRKPFLKLSSVYDYKNTSINKFNIFDSFDENNYSIIFLPYCSSDVHMGSHQRNIDGKEVFFNGKIIFESLLKKFNKELSKAEELVFGGYSAGSIAIAGNLEKISKLQNPNTRFILDSYWLDEEESKVRKNWSKEVLNYLHPSFPDDCANMIDCYPSKNRFTKYSYKDLFVVWNVEDQFRRSKNIKKFKKLIKADIDFFGAGISLDESVILSGNFRSLTPQGNTTSHVVLFESSFYQEINGIKIKDVFDNWLLKKNKNKILINF